MTEKILTDENGNEIDLEDEENFLLCQQSGLCGTITLKIGEFLITVCSKIIKAWTLLNNQKQFALQHLRKFAFQSALLFGMNFVSKKVLSQTIQPVLVYQMAITGNSSIRIQPIKVAVSSIEK